MKIKLSFLLILISILSFSQDKKTIKNFVENFVEYRMKDLNFGKRDGQVLLLGMAAIDDFPNCKSLQIEMNHTSFLMHFPYKNVVEVKGFKAIVYENEFAKNFNGVFKKLAYENFNLGKVDYNATSHPKTWTFVFNNKNEIELIYSFQEDFELIKFLKMKDFKFSKDFKKNMGFD